MPSFLSSLNPLSHRSGITHAATGHAYSDRMKQAELHDLTLDLVIPFLWHRNLSILDGIYETFTVFYGDHFDKHARGFGQKGVLDFAYLPLFARRIIADTYIEERKNAYISNSLAWIVGVSIRAITFLVALVFTIAMIPIIIIATLLRACCCPPPGSSSLPPPFPPLQGGDDVPPIPPNNGPNGVPLLPLHTATTALFQITRDLERAGIRNRANLRGLLVNRHALAVVYVLERLADSYDEAGNLVLNQEVFDFVMAHWQIFSSHDFLNFLNAGVGRDRPLSLEELRDITVNPRQIWPEPARRQAPLMGAQSTHTASVHRSVSASAIRLEHLYENAANTDCFNFLRASQEHFAKWVKGYDKKLVGNQSDADITSAILATIDRIERATFEDPQSKVKLTRLLQLCFAAVCDPSRHREGVTEEVAMPCLYAALYEINREYALSDTGVDLGYGGLAESCEGGAFNKLIEALAKIHQSCEVNFITPATAGLKLPFVVQDCLRAYLQDHPEIDIENLKKNGLDEIWSDLQPFIFDRMYEDFGSLYPLVNGQANPALVAMVSAGQDIDLSCFNTNAARQQTIERQRERRGELVMMS